MNDQNSKPATTTYVSRPILRICANCHAEYDARWLHGCAQIDIGPMTGWTEREPGVWTKDPETQETPPA